MPDRLKDGREVWVFGSVVSDFEESFDKLRFAVRVDSGIANGVVYDANVTVMVRTVRFSPVPEVGEEYAFKGRFDALEPLPNPGGFDSQGYYTRSGISFLFKCSDTAPVRLTTMGKSRTSLGLAAARTRRKLYNIFTTAIGGNEAGLIAAVLLGQRGGMGRAMSDRFADAGVIHILAVSGLHVGILWFVLITVLRTIRVPQKTGVVLSCLLLVFYCFITSLRSPVERATIMFICFSLTSLMEREIDSFNAVCVAALVILILAPSCIFDAGFQLSFACTVSIVRLYGPATSLFPGLFSVKTNALLRWALGATFVSLCAQLGSIPLAMYHFNRLPWAALIANLVVVPLAGVDIWLGLTVAAFGCLKGPLLGLAASANWLSLKLTLASVDFFSSVRFFSFRTVRPPVLALAIWYLLLFLLPELKKSRRARIASFLIILVGANCFLWDCALKKPRARLSASFLDVGQGDCCFLETDTGERALIDAGPNLGDYDSGERVVAPFLWQKGIRRIDRLVLSHCDNDHIGGTEFVLDHFAVGEVIDGGAIVPSAEYLSFLQKVKKSGTEYTIARRGSRIDFGGNRISVLYPDGEAIKLSTLDRHFKPNNSSVVLLLDCGRTRLLFAGDVDEDIERITESIRRVDLLKVPHHGSKIVNEAILKSGLIPSVAVISVASGNRFNLPNKGVVAGYLRSGTRLYRTDRDGCIFFETDGTGYKLSTMRELQNMPPVKRFLRRYR